MPGYSRTKSSRSLSIYFPRDQQVGLLFGIEYSLHRPNHNRYSDWNEHMQSSLRWIPQPAGSRDFIGAIYDLISPPLGQVLWACGLHDRTAVQEFLTAEYLALPNPFGLRDMDRAVARVRTAVLEHEAIALFGDFDADGITSVALLDQVLRALGLRVVPYIPKRSEGYGLTMAAIEQLAAQASVLITVDCGTSNVEEIARAQALGMDVMVIDHHTPPNVLPPALAVVNPLRPDCTYPSWSCVQVRPGPLPSRRSNPAAWPGSPRSRRNRHRE